MYSLAKADLAACLIRLREESAKTVLQDEEFRFYHRHRNHYNDITAKSLTQIAPYDNWRNPLYRDEYGRTWIEETIGVFFHVKDKTTFLKFGKLKKEREARKFLMATPLPGYTGCTSEMIVQRSGNRVSSGEYMETFNFGPSGARSSMFEISIAGFNVVDSGLHYKFDIAPHREFGGHKDYVPYSKSPGPVRIIDVQDLLEQGRVKETELRIQ